MKRLKNIAIASSLLLSTVLISFPASAQSDEEWQVSGALNLWGAGIKGSLINGTKIDVGFSDTLENLDLTFMGTLEARKSKWSMVGDLIYLGVSQDTGATLPSGAGVDAEVTGLVLNLIGGHNLLDTEDGRIDVIFGARHIDLETKIKAVGPGAIGTRDGDAWDAIIGIRGQRFIDEKWYLPYHFDVGAGDSDSTWQALVGVGYRYNWGDVTFAYRRVEWEFDASAPIQDMAFSGPGVQFKWHF